MKRIALVSLLALCCGLAFADEIKLTTIVPGGGTQAVMRAEKGAVGSTYSKTATIPDSSVPTSSLVVEGPVGIGTQSPQAKLSFNDVNDGSNGADGITWYNPAPTYYGIYRGAGAWSAPNYQQLNLTWATGIVINGGTAYGRSGIVLQPNGGNVGIGTGTTGPAHKLQVAVGTTEDHYQLRLGTLDNYYDIGRNYSNGLLYFTGNQGDPYKGFVFNGGNVGIGTTNPIVKLHIETGNAQTNAIYAHTNNVGAAAAYIRNDAPGGIGIYDQSAQSRFFGNVQIDGNLHVNGDIAAGGHIYYHNSIIVESDLRFKENIALLPDPISKLENLRGVSFDWKRADFKEKNFPEGRQIGVIAQELEKEYPELVSTDDKGYKSVDYGRLTAVLLEAIKEQQREIRHQGEEIEELKKDIVVLKNRS